MSPKRFFSALLLLVLFGAVTQPVYATEHKVSICHKEKNTLVVDSHAVPAHLAHGDVLGACGPVDPPTVF